MGLRIGPPEAPLVDKAKALIPDTASAIASTPAKSVGGGDGHAARSVNYTSLGGEGHAKAGVVVEEMGFPHSRTGFLYSSQSETSLSSQSSLLSSRGSNLSYASSVLVKALIGSVGEGGIDDDELCSAARVQCKCVATFRSCRGGAAVATSLGGHAAAEYTYAEKMAGGMQEAAGSPMRAVVRVGERLFSAHDDHKIRVWRGPPTPGRSATTDTCRHLATLPTVLEHVRASLFASSYVQVRRHHKRLWMQHVDAISALAVGSARTDVLYSGSWDRTVKVWRLSDLRCVESFKAHDDAVNAIAVSPDGRFLYTASADSQIRVWVAPPAPRVKAGHSLLATLAGHKSAVNALAISPDGALLYSGACDKAILVWQRSSSRDEAGAHLVLAGALRGHRHAVLCMAAYQQGRVHALCSGSADRTVRIWQRFVGTPASSRSSTAHVCVAVLHGHSGPVKSLSVPASATLDSITLYSGCLRHDEIKVWNISLLE